MNLKWVCTGRCSATYGLYDLAGPHHDGGACLHGWFFNGLLGALRRMIGRKLRVIWHGVGCQKSRQVRQWLEAHNGQLAIAFPPPQALDLNPVEAILAYLKKQEIAKVCPTTLTEAGDFARSDLLAASPGSRLVSSGLDLPPHSQG